MYALVKFSDETYHVSKISQLPLLTHTLRTKKKKAVGIYRQVEIVVRHRK